MKTPDSIRVILYQKPLGIGITRKDINEMKEFRPHFVCFPEYFFVSQRLGNHGQTPKNQKRQIKRIENLSRELATVIIGGTMPELDGPHMHNTCFIFDCGKNLGFYRKKHLFYAEEGIITPGDTYKVFTAWDITFGVLICADIFYDSSFEFMKNSHARVIFSPTFSLFKKETVETKYTRDKEIYVRGSQLSNAPIVKVCGVPSEYRPYLQARSLISTPEDILFRVNPDEEDKSIIIKQKITL